MTTSALVHSLSLEGQPGGDPRSLLELVDRYLVRSAEVREARDDGASPERLAAMARQLDLAGIAAEIAARIGPGTAVVRAGHCLALVPPPGGGPPELAVLAVVQDLDHLASLEADREWERQALRLAGLCARSGPGLLADDERDFLSGAVCFLSDAELSEARQALPFFEGREPRDMIELGELARELVARVRMHRRRGRPTPEEAFLGLEAALADAPESTGPIGPESEPLPPNASPWEDAEGID